MNHVEVVIMDKYTIDVLDYSSKLDAMVSGCGEISKLAALIIEHQDPKRERERKPR